MTGKNYDLENPRGDEPKKNAIPIEPREEKLLGKNPEGEGHIKIGPKSGAFEGSLPERPLSQLLADAGVTIDLSGLLGVGKDPVAGGSLYDKDRKGPFFKDFTEPKKIPPRPFKDRLIPKKPDLFESKKLQNRILEPRRNHEIPMTDEGSPLYQIPEGETGLPLRAKWALDDLERKLWGKPLRNEAITGDDGEITEQPEKPIDPTE